MSNKTNAGIPRPKVESEVIEGVPFKDVGGKANHCWDNVEMAVRKYGGEIVPGWLIDDDHPQLRQTAEHFLWKDQDGQLWDVTPHVRCYGNGETKVEFASRGRFRPDPTVKPNFKENGSWKCRAFWTAKNDSRDARKAAQIANSMNNAKTLNNPDKRAKGIRRIKKLVGLTKLGDAK